VPGSFRVTRHVRPKLSCRTCEMIAQAPAPSLPIRRGRAGAGLLAHVLVAKYCDHLPLHRQAEIYAREDIDLPRSTLADMVGQTARLVRPLVDVLARHVMAGQRVHADDTVVPVLEPGLGRTRTARLWIPASAGAGSTFATIGHSPGRLRRRRSIGIRRTARGSTHGSICGTSKVSWQLTDMPGMPASMATAAWSRPPAWPTRGASSGMCMRQPNPHSPARRWIGSPPSIGSRTGSAAARRVTACVSGPSIPRR
jgi:hypothetical protein